jgi:PAS domain S-box-containing protein
VKEQTKILGEITARLKHTEKVLHASEDKYRALVENADCIILRIDPKGNITFFNEFAQKFFGYTEREILGKNVIGTIIPKTDKSGRNFTKIEKAIRQHPQRYATYESENIRKDGRRVWVVWANKIIRDKQKNMTEILCVGHDITQRKLMENELRLLAAVVHNSNDAIMVQDMKGYIISWNLGAQRMYGYSKSEAMKLNADSMIPEHKHNEIQELIEKLKKK